ncbi:MAG: peptide ABC transporter substrate-binding protein [Caldilineaceae bacterium]
MCKRCPLLAALVVTITILAGCATQANTPTASPPAAGAAPGGRGADGELVLVYWQEISLLNPYLANGIKDYQAASLVLEPLVKNDPDGNMLPVLAVEVPTLDNGGVAPDLKSITYKLRPGIVWSDGTPLTADDVVFTWQYCTDPATGCGTLSSFAGVTRVEALDPQTVKLNFDGPQPYPYAPFGGQLSPVLQKAQFAPCLGAAAQGCATQNTMPIGTGPFVVDEFRANDTVVYRANDRYRVPDQPHFSRLVIRGAEDAAAAARAVLETGEADYAWNLLVEPAVLDPMVAKGKGQLVSAFAGSVERIMFNFTNPDPALGDKRSEWSMDDPNPHPFLSDPAVRQAMSMAIDRKLIATQLFGIGGRPTCNILAEPPAVVSPNNDACLQQDLAGAKQLLETNGWIDTNGDGVREKDGVELRVLFQTATSSVRQKIQLLVQAWWQEIGIATELRNIESAVFFSGDPASPDTLGKFYADTEMFANGPDSPDPQNYLVVWTCEVGSESNIAASANNWLRPNIERWCSSEYDTLFATYQAAVDPQERAKLAIALNDMIVQNYVNLPLISRATVSAYADNLQGVVANGWENTLWNIQEWRRTQR